MNTNNNALFHVGCPGPREKNNGSQALAIFGSVGLPEREELLRRFKTEPRWVAALLVERENPKQRFLSQVRA